MVYGFCWKPAESFKWGVDSVGGRTKDCSWWEAVWERGLLEQAKLLESVGNKVKIIRATLVEIYQVCEN